MKVYSNLNPIYNSNSKILILGTMPSVKSREVSFYYANPQNRFWPIMENLFNINLTNNKTKKEFLLKNNIALWDVLSSCDIKGSSDSTIKNITPNNLDVIFNNCSINAVFCTGTTAYNLYNKCFKNNIPVYPLPSPSSANAKYKLDNLIKEYTIIKSFLK